MSHTLLGDTYLMQFWFFVMQASSFWIKLMCWALSVKQDNCHHLKFEFIVSLFDHHMDIIIMCLRPIFSHHSYTKAQKLDSNNNGHNNYYQLLLKTHLIVLSSAFNSSLWISWSHSFCTTSWLWLLQYLQVYAMFVHILGALRYYISLTLQWGFPDW